MEQTTYIAIILGAGKGLRMASTLRKQYLELDGIPVLVHTLNAFDRHPCVSQIFLVTPAEDHAFCRSHILSPHSIETPVEMVAGGPTRQESVYNGLQAARSAGLTPDKTMALVHDGVRPFVSHGLLDRLMEGALPRRGAIPALPMTDTVKESRDGIDVAGTVDRKRLYRVQTPQVFSLDLLLSAYETAKTTGFQATDDASVMENSGHAVSLVKGSEANIKLTTPWDMKLASFLIEKSLD